ncbi:Putative peptide transport system permease protein BRA1093/BS1330_II1085 [Geodia barretti]|uniref:Peptide transport system permease protein BRA1093/BS1330_II1085 n=1 Tax=Geodia barretti TaxID=519541 RepID=A0AA35RH48_GEOBA|nr:Putative peptide transport system permease protein BRA1093/BS1330_II1085 [Geodia barretti]
MAVFRTNAAAEEPVLQGDVRQRPTGLAGIWAAIWSFSKRKPLGAIGAVVILAAVAVAVLAPWVAPHNPEGVGIAKKFSPPGTESAPLGTDHIGRDVLSRLIHGARISMYVGIMTVLVGITIGTMVGISSAYMGGVFDMIVQRIVDALMGFPPIILALGLMAALGADINNVIIALVVILVPGATRVVRSEALRIKELDYILASRAIGANPVRVMWNHILPNVAATYIVLMTITLGFAIVVEASLSFLGVGVPEGVATWGSMLEIGREHIHTQTWLVVFPGVIIAAVVFAVNFLGDGLRDVLDPRLRGR